MNGKKPFVAGLMTWPEFRCHVWGQRLTEQEVEEVRKFRAQQYVARELRDNEIYWLLNPVFIVDENYVKPSRRRWNNMNREELEDD